MARVPRKEEFEIVKHRHCAYCGLPIKMDKRFCSIKCESEYRKAERKTRRQLYIIFFIPLAFLLMIYLFAYLGAR
jgi:predicted nucleic acid-binding Zn ribbon protein